MRGSEFAELKIFTAVAERLSFSRAAEQMGMSASAVSQSIRVLEGRLSVRLLNRTTRTVVLTDAGTRLYERVAPLFTAFQEALEEVGESSSTPHGTLRLCAPQMALLHVLQPMLARFRRDYPGIVLDITSDDSIDDIVGRGFDVGIRLGGLIDKDMIAVRISEPLQQIAVASPAYIRAHGEPATPNDLLHHQCINWRRPGRMDVDAWHFAKEERTLSIDVVGNLVVNDCAVALRSAIDGLGVTVWTEEWIGQELRDEKLVPVLRDWSPAPSAFYLYHPSRSRVPAHVRAFIASASAQVG